jgi:hypothetical protein
VDRLRTLYGRCSPSPVADRCLSTARPKSGTPFRRDLFHSPVGRLSTVVSITTTGGAAMRSETTTTINKQTASVQSRGDSVNQVSFSGASSRPRSCGKPHPASTSRPYGSRPTVRAASSSTTWSYGASSPNSLASNSARDTSSTSRVGSRAASGRPPSAAHDGASRSVPTGSRRLPRRALRRLRRHNVGPRPRGGPCSALSGI